MIDAIILLCKVGGLTSGASNLPSHYITSASTTIQGFKKTHSDRWSEMGNYFTREQMEDLEDERITPHYFS